MRVALTEAIFLAEPINYGEKASAKFKKGLEVFIFERGTEDEAVLMSLEEGGVALAQPLLTDRDGRPRSGATTAWVEEGSYDLVVEGERVQWEAAKGGAESAAAGEVKGERERAEAAEKTKATPAEVQVEQLRAEAAEGLKLTKAGNLGELANVATARNNLGLGTAATHAVGDFDLAGTAAAERAVEQGAREAAITILNLGSNWSAGDLLGVRAAAPPAAHKLDLRDGTAAAPVKIGTSTSISRVDATTRAEVNEKIGPAGTDGPDGATALRVSIKGTAASQVQILAGAFHAWHTGEANGGEASADAGALYAISKVTGNAVGRAIPLYLESNRETATSGGQQALEIRVKNSSGASDAYVFNGASKSMGIWLNAQSAGEADTAAGFQFGHGFGRQFDVGIGFNASSVKTTAIRDDSEAVRSILITKPHSKAAIASASGAGPWLINLEERNFAGEQLLEVGFGEAALDPGVAFGSGLGKSQSIMPIRNSTGNAKIFVSNAANAFLTGTAQGDTGINFTAGKTFHIGAQTKTSLLRVNETGVGVNGAAPVAKAAAIAEPAQTLEGHQAAINSIRTALKNFGITA